MVLKPPGDVFAAVAPQIFVVYEGTSDYATAGKTRRYMAVSVARDMLFAAAFVDVEGDVVGFGASRLWR